MTANCLIYASVAFGVVLLAQLYFIIFYTLPWLFYSVLIGWIAYFIVAIGATLRIGLAYPAAVVLAILTLAVSIPQPEHYSFGLSLASLTFISGSVLQVGVIFAAGRYLVLTRKDFQNK